MPENTIRAFGQSPESLAGALRRLYHGYMATGDEANGPVTMGE